MIKKAKIVGLDCAHCAKTLENEINKLKEINSCETILEEIKKYDW